MREYLISAGRHVAGAVVGALTAFLASQGIGEAIDPSVIDNVQTGIESVVVFVGLAVYALAEKALKPIVRRIFGSEGTA